MERPTLRLALVLSLLAWLAACSTPKPATEPPPELPAPVPLADDASMRMQTIRFLEEKAREDPGARAENPDAGAVVDVEIVAQLKAPHDDVVLGDGGSINEDEVGARDAGAIDGRKLTGRRPQGPDNRWR